jgi:hypothetical protein
MLPLAQCTYMGGILACLDIHFGRYARAVETVKRVSTHGEQGYGIA